MRNDKCRNTAPFSVHVKFTVKPAGAAVQSAKAKVSKGSDVVYEGNITASSGQNT